MKDVATTIIVTAAGAVMAGIGAALLVPAMRARRAIANTKWQNVRGTIVDSRVEETTYTRSVGANRRTRTSYKPVVAYEFLVDKIAYRGARIHLGAVVGSADAASAQAQLERYPLGAQVDVYFDPEDPNAAVLERRASQLPLVIGALLALVGAGFAIVALAR